jgi:phosphate starvation-inducible PhoH-like protein
LQVVREILADVDDITFSLLTSSDVVRHRLVGRIVDAYERWDAENDDAPDDQQRRLVRPEHRSQRGQTPGAQRETRR